MPKLNLSPNRPELSELEHSLRTNEARKTFYLELRSEESELLAQARMEFERARLRLQDLLKRQANSDQMLAEIELEHKSLEQRIKARRSEIATLAQANRSHSSTPKAKPQTNPALQFSEQEIGLMVASSKLSREQVLQMLAAARKA
jgi:chromosome segregation ATPase